MQTIYRPGQWYLIVIPGALVALPPDVHSDLISRLWDRLPAEKTLASVVDVLTTAAGGSFVGLPPFVAAVVEGSAVRIALRGGVVARVSSASDAAYELSGAEVTTWSEHFVSDATRIEITVEETDAATVLPVQSGIVRAAAASAELEADDDAPIAAALGSTPRIDEIESGASAAALAGGSAPALALFGGPSSPHVDGTPDVAVAAPPVTVAPAVPAVVPVGSAAPVPEDPTAAEASDAAPEPVESEPAESEPADSELVEPEPAEPELEPEPVSESADIADTTSDVPEQTIDPTEAIAAGDSIPHAITDPTTAPAVPEDAVPEDAVPEETVSDEVGVDERTGIDEHTWEPPQRSFAATSESDESGADESGSDESGLDEIEQLFEETLHSASGAQGVPPVPPLAQAPALGDHDGATITSAELADLRRRQAASDDVATQVLPAVPSGHGRIRVSSGQVVELDRPVIIGRRPRSTRASGETLPHLVAVDSPQQDISRNHIEVRPDAGTVVVIDLRTTNGSTLVRPGAEPMRLHPGEQTLVLSGDVIDLGDGVTVLFEDIP